MMDLNIIPLQRLAIARAEQARAGCWTLTASGRAMFPGVPKPEQICIGDVAEHLAKINRWAGATTAPYSVAQHSVLVAQKLAEEAGPTAALYGLLHDAHEAYLGDVPGPVKELVAALSVADTYGQLETFVHSEIMRALGIPWPVGVGLTEAIAAADRIVLASEARDLMPDAPRGMEAVVTPKGARLLTSTIRAWTWTVAEERFRAAYERYRVASGVDLAAKCETGMV